MLALSDWPLDARRSIQGVLTDIDDTLTTHGAITPDALAALANLKSAGFKVVAITGRPIGWCERFMAGPTPWPVDAMVAENGAVAWVRQLAPAFANKNEVNALSDKAGLLSKIYQQSPDTRLANKHRMLEVANQIVQSVPGAQVTQDSAGRETDLAIDHAEFTKLTPAAIEAVLHIMTAAGMQTTVSSIHIHGCFGHFNKWQGARWIVRALYGQDLAADLDHWAFVGDSGNDESLFENLTHTVGVANIRQVAATLKYLPRYVTPSEKGAGFAEVAGALLEPRQP
jgi:HAD superfamily hydrolase (TIGR01484 family)